MIYRSNAANTWPKNISTGAGSCSGLYTFGIQLEIQETGLIYELYAPIYNLCIQKTGMDFKVQKSAS
uniref:Uncharacterized protein n=1 Tax=Solanum tuberosum TaxID=4113 RepID=M1CW86_SOLTU